VPTNPTRIRFAVLIGVLAVVAYVVGLKPVTRWAEVACPPGYTEQPVSVQSGVYRCIPPGGAAGLDLNRLPGGSRQREVGLYLANLNVRVFDCDFEQGNCLWLASNVPPPP
jgi:hypothetical protein